MAGRQLAGSSLSLLLLVLKSAGGERVLAAPCEPARFAVGSKALTSFQVKNC